MAQSPNKSRGAKCFASFRNSNVVSADGSAEHSRGAASSSLLGLVPLVPTSVDCLNFLWCARLAVFNEGDMPPSRMPAPPPSYDATNPLIVQSDRSILVEVDNPKYAAARDELAPFAELEKSPEHIHTYRISNLSLWNAAAAGVTAEQMVDVLTRYSKFPIPLSLPADLAETVSRYGRVKLERAGGNLVLVCRDKPLLEELARQKTVRGYLGDRIDDTRVSISPQFRGVLKQALIGVGYPVEDLAGYTSGADLPTAIRAVA